MGAESLRSKTFHALAWSLAESVGVQGVRLVMGIVLARLLFPEEFGLIGMLTIFIAVAQSFLDSGFGAALIQKRNATQTDKCSIFYFNIVFGLITAGGLCLFAPWIAAFYKQPILTAVTRAMSVTLVVNSFSLIQSTILAKEIDFKTQTKASLIASVMSGILGITMAGRGFGVWSLVGQQMSSAICRTVLLWLWNSWRPALIFSFQSLREMFGFGSRLLASGILEQVFGNIYSLVIGKLFSAADLGYFTRAQTLGEVPSQTLSSMVGRVTFPVFAMIRDDTSRLKNGMKKAITTLVFINFPMMIGMAVVARPLVLVILSEKWAESIPYLQLLCMVGLLYPLHLINLNVLQALGRSDYFLRLEVIKKILIVINIVVTWQFGISAMICGMIAFSAIAYYLNSYYTGILVGYSAGEQLRDWSGYLMIAALMGGAVYLVGWLPFRRLWSMLLVQVCFGVIFYGSLCRLFRMAAFMDFWQTGCRKMSFLRAGILA